MREMWALLEKRSRLAAGAQTQNERNNLRRHGRQKFQQNRNPEGGAAGRGCCCCSLCFFAAPCGAQNFGNRKPANGRAGQPPLPASGNAAAKQADRIDGGAQFLRSGGQIMPGGFHFAQVILLFHKNLSISQRRASRVPENKGRRTRLLIATQRATASST